MEKPPTVIGVSGSRREESVTRIAVREALAGVDSRGGSATFLDLRNFDLPPYNPSDSAPEDAAGFTDQIRRADAIILGTPMYHGSYSGVLKNAIDYCGFEEFENKTIGLVGVAGGRFPLSALEHLRTVCRSLNAWVLPTQAAIPRADSNVSGGALDDEEIVSRLHTLGTRAVEYANIEPDPPMYESTENVGARNHPTG